MNRRNFLKITITSALVPTYTLAASTAPTPDFHDLDRSNLLTYNIVQHLKDAYSKNNLQLQFEPNDDVARQTFAYALSYVCNLYVKQGDIVDYRVVCDSSNNSPSSIHLGVVCMDITFTNRYYITTTLSFTSNHTLN